MTVTIFGGVDPPGRGERPLRDLRNWQTIYTWATDALAAAAGAGKTTASQ